MIRSVKGVELNKTEYIKEAGLYRFKVEKVGFDGYDNKGDEVPKLTFSCLQVIKVDGKPTLGTTVFTHEEKYSGNENLMWKSKILQVAMKAPEVFDFNDLQGHYVMVDVTLRESNGKMYAQASKMSYSKANDTLAAIPEPKAQQQEAPASYAPVPEAIEEISSDELPF